MPDIAVLALFVPTFFFVSITPGMCMSLAMTLGMSVGYKKTLYMMVGELIGVAVVAICSVYGVATLVLDNPTAFSVFKIIGAIYLFYLGVKLYLTPVVLSTSDQRIIYQPAELIMQGFTTAFSNPKGWAFMITLLPPFLDTSKPLSIQLTVLVIIILCSEFICMSVYALGGKKLSQLLANKGKAQWLNVIAGSLLCFVGIWLAFS